MLAFHLHFFLEHLQFLPSPGKTHFMNHSQEPISSLSFIGTPKVLRPLLCYLWVLPLIFWYFSSFVSPVLDSELLKDSVYLINLYNSPTIWHAHRNVVINGHHPETVQYLVLIIILCVSQYPAEWWTHSGNDEGQWIAGGGCKTG